LCIDIDSIKNVKTTPFPPEIIQYAAWFHHRFNLSHRDIEGLMSHRGVEVSYDAIRLWCNKFGPKYAQRLRRKHRGYGDTFFIGEVFVKIQGQRYYLLRAVDQDGEVVDNSYRSGVMEKLQSVSLRGYCVNTKANQKRLSPISSEVTAWLIESLSLQRFTTPLRQQSM
jgi:hypothetical protein